MKFARTLKRTEYRAPNYFKNVLGENIEGDLIEVQLASQDGRYYGALSTFIAEYLDPGVTKLIADMFGLLEVTMRKSQNVFGRCKLLKEEDIKLEADEFRANNIV